MRLEKNMQTPCGDHSKWFFQFGFYVGFLLLFVLILGIYVTYTGLIKRETTKAIQAIMNFLVVFLFVLVLYCLCAKLY